LLNHTTNEAFELNPLAHHQLADYLGVQRGFYDRMREDSEHLLVPLWIPAHTELSADLTIKSALVPEGMEESPLLDVIVNTLLRRKGKDGRLIRTLDGKARAFLSDSYNPDLDNFDVFTVAAGVIEANGLSAENVISAEVTEHSLYIKVVSPRLQAVINPSNLQKDGMLKEPQVLQAGFVISNSETGLGALRVRQMVFKLMCSNMWIKEDTYKVRHIGKELTADEGGIVYQDDTRQAEAKAKLLKIRDHVKETLNEHRFRQMVSKMQESTDIALATDLTRVVEVTGRKFGLLKTELDSVLQNLIQGADLSLWGLTNAVTTTAHQVESYDRATELEEIGGRLYSISEADLKEIVYAK
jgi:hypothetical protein